MSNIERNIDRLQDEGHSVYIAGWDDRGRYCLIVSPKGLTVAHADTANGIGRWENHREELAFIASTRFPHRHRPAGVPA